MDMTIPAEVAEIPHIKELEEENELLLSQLHLVQEELEKYYLRNKELESRQPSKLQDTTPSAKGWVDDELPDVLAENRRLQTLVEVQQKVHQLETHNALNVRLGNILIESAASSGSLLSVPGKLRKIWKEENQQTPPESLGGKGFDKIIAAYGEGGFDAVEKLIAGVSISPAMQASALTALARYLMANNRTQAAEAARRAYTLDPKPFRLKWLAFRLHEAGEVAEAEAMLAILPTDTPFSDSEARQASRLRSEAKNARQRAAKQQTAFFERRGEIDRQLNNLKRERDEQSKLVADRSDEIEQCNQKLNSLQQANSRLEQEKSDQIKRCEAAESQVIECNREIEALKQVHAQQEQTLTQLEREKQALEAQQEERDKQIAERNQKIEAFKQAQVQLEQEKAALAQRIVEQMQLTEERGREIAALKQVQVQQKQTLAQLEQERVAQTKRHDEAEKLAAERLKQINELKQKIQSHQSSEAESATRQQRMQEEMARAEAQLDLIKDMLLIEPAL